MSKIIIIENCKGCFYLSHSGGYTPGGLQWTCNNNKTVRKRGAHWTNRVLNPVKPTEFPEEIPDWCPLEDI